MIRRRRCQYLAIAVIALHLVVFSLLSAKGSEKLLPLQSITNSLYDYALLFKEGDSFPFDAWADKVFGDYLRDQGESGSQEARLAAFSTNSSAFGADNMEVKLPEFLKGDSENPLLMPFEPRLTLGMILNEYNHLLKETEGRTPASFEYNIPVFHWADWTDLSSLYPHFMSFGENRQSCKMFGKTPRKTRKNPNPEKTSPHWCLDDSEIAFLYHENIIHNAQKKAGFREILQSPLRTGFHVDKYGGRTPHTSKKFEAASYLNDFMDKPLSVILLLPHPSGRSRSLRLGVNREVGSRVRLSQSDLAKSVANRVDTVNLRDELRQLESYYTNEGSDMYAPNIELHHEDFIEDSRVKLKELQSRNNLTTHEHNYFLSLNLSLSETEPTKYLYEAELHKSSTNWAWGSHYDWRFYKEIINFTELQAPSLHSLTSAWLRFINAQHLNSWVAHGTLLSWYWNGINFPWDADVDVQMPIKDLHRLARDFNQSVIVDFGTDVNGEIKTGRYFIDIGTWISSREYGNGRNNIDGRFIDMDTGLYIDITGLSISNTIAPKEYDRDLPKGLKRVNPDRSMDELEVLRNNYLQVYNCRNKHFAWLHDLSPMKLTYVEGVPAYVPNDFMLMLQREYNAGGLFEQRYKRYVFLPRLRVWYPSDKVNDFVTGKGKDFEPILELGTDKSKAVSSIDKMAVYSMSDEDYLEFMAREKPLLVEYLATRDVTSLHEKEMKQLLKNKPTDQLLLENEQLVHQFSSFRRDYTKFRRVKENFSFDEKVNELAQEMFSFRKGVSLSAEEVDYDPEPEPVNQDDGSPAPAVKFQPVGSAPERPRNMDA
ncbi:hypothetical protein FT663_04403 [Candidozyma haemuli var. vulneris]|uniref:LicD/FKTN/FKRP nucleotidyltransferase domain-containing protein n=1 Tax=Candidozyma haemuli TaxID=45357 RepID=A0A2V1ATU1_9ASCO|nr:hypothetical protein CXQ85_000151 [[Candida] haemuloni]KAF3987586.1 hypothetical protein FT663_04403 [[Candida] haemuloni var. vulneris]KAF3988908.1 hypothetical protein FT662_03141 [[Candida] haemuloni var. vulneris]PVH21184.1 hypothetical protein CXQ85_000151 [[Candida] haemuloni]